ncbi:MAG: ester cyclase [Rhizobiaceae bacterium]
MKNGCLPIPQALNIANKRLVQQAMSAIADCQFGQLEEVLSSYYSEDADWRGSHPLNEIRAVKSIAEVAWAPLKNSLPDMERRDEIIVGGRYRNRHGQEQDMVACIGHFCGTFKRDWLDIPATGQPLFVRYGEVHIVEDGKIIASTCLWDVLDVIRQAGFWPLAPSWGTEGRWMGPITCDGLVFDQQDMEQGLASIAQTLAMHKTLSDYRDDEMKGRDGLINMPQKEHWHEKMMWYGPSGIGTTRGLEGFVDFHQLPFRLFWPGRKGGQSIINEETAAGEQSDAGHYIQIGDGPYSVTGGWPSVVAQNRGGGLFGSGATGRITEMRVMDFYLHHEGKIRENWIPIDVIHILLQLDIDVMARVRDQFGRNRLGLRP